MAAFNVLEMMNSSSRAAAAGVTDKYQEIYLNPYEVKQAQDNTHKELKDVEELADNFLIVGQQMKAGLWTCRKAWTKNYRLSERGSDMEEIENTVAQQEGGANGAGVPGVVTMTAEELQAALRDAARLAVRELRKEEAKEKKRNKYHDTFSLMRCYRDAVFHIENAISEGAQLDTEGMTEEQQEIYLRSIRRTRFRTMLMTANVDKAIEEMEKRRRAAGRELEYQVFDMYFMQGMTYEEIIEQVEKDSGERLGKNTPRRWVTGIINEMSVLLWGIEDDK